MYGPVVSCARILRLHGSWKPALPPQDAPEFLGQYLKAWWKYIEDTRLERSLVDLTQQVPC